MGVGRLFVMCERFVRLKKVFGVELKTFGDLFRKWGVYNSWKIYSTHGPTSSSGSETAFKCLEIP